MYWANRLICLVITHSNCNNPLQHPRLNNHSFIHSMVLSFLLLIIATQSGIAGGGEREGSGILVIFKEKHCLRHWKHAVFSSIALYSPYVIQWTMQFKRRAKNYAQRHSTLVHIAQVNTYVKHGTSTLAPLYSCLPCKFILLGLALLFIKSFQSVLEPSLHSFLFTCLRKLGLYTIDHSLTVHSLHLKYYMLEDGHS